MLLSLADFSQELSSEWDFEKNYPITPSQISFKKTLRAFWICKTCNFEWAAVVYDRTMRKTGCRRCSGQVADKNNNLVIKRPDLLLLWDFDKNAIEPTDIKEFSSKKVWWKCQCGHSWNAIVANVSGGSRCPACNHKAITTENSFGGKYPKMLEQWDYSKNTIDPFSVFPNTTHNVWWKCANNHSWSTQLVGRVQDQSDCNQCLGRVASRNNNFAVRNPNLVKEWDYSNNIGNPEDYSNMSNYRANWICSNGHKWDINIYCRSTGTGCPTCSMLNIKKDTKIELILQKLFEVDGWNKPPENSNIKKLPDIRLSDTLYVNADGTYYHSDEFKARDYHYKIWQEFEKNGLRILQFYADEILEKSHIIKGMCDSLLNRNKAIGARKLKLFIQNNNSIADFLNQNHIIGKSPISRNVSLIDDSMSVLMTLCYNVYSEKIYITRVCTKIGITVQGGLSRLLAYIKKEYPGKTIITQTDNRYADGHSLETLGFVKIKSYIQYKYTNGKIRLDKRHFRVKAGTNETEEALKKGFYRIYDAGKITWALKT